MDVCAVYCLDRAEKPGEEWEEAERRVEPQWGGELHYKRVDVTDTDLLGDSISQIADDHQRLDGLLTAAAVQQIAPALDYQPDDLMHMMSVNYKGVYMASTAAARAMRKYGCDGSICIVASMSGLVANKGLLSSVYNSGKAALIQLARNLAMEWGDGKSRIRVNCLSPGHCMTPMVKKNLADEPHLKKEWERENMMHRLARAEEFKSPGLFLLSRSSSFMTGANLVVDGGHTAW